MRIVTRSASMRDRQGRAGREDRGAMPQVTPGCESEPCSAVCRANCAP